MKLTIASVLFTLFIVSAVLNTGLIMGYVKIGNPEKLKEIAYNDSQRYLMDQLVSDAQ